MPFDCTLFSLQYMSLRYRVFLAVWFFFGNYKLYNGHWHEQDVALTAIRGKKILFFIFIFFLHFHANTDSNAVQDALAKEHSLAFYIQTPV